MGWRGHKQAMIPMDFTKCISGSAGKLFPAWFSIPCLECVCSMQAGREKCQVRRKSCPPLKCMIYETRYSNCCRVCKGCYYNGVSFKNMDEWSDSEDPCKKFVCREGIVSEYTEQCHQQMQISSGIKLIHKQSSSSCCYPKQDAIPGSNNNGTAIDSVKEEPSKDDPCTVCKSLDGVSYCRKKTCPVLPCVLEDNKDPSTCCRKCDASQSRSRFLPEKWCLINDVQVEDGKWHKVDSCNLCQCKNGTAMCKITTCPKLECKRENLVFSGHRCCPQCRDTTKCTFMGKTYTSGETWYLKKCVKCSCKKGRNVCMRQKCTNEPRNCPNKQTLGYKVGSCCKVCVEEQHSCVTYGDPHYQTFDGRFYSFQGTCRYMLAKDSNNTFSVIVKNSARYTGRFAWTKSVHIKLGKYTISLQQKLKVKVNGKRIRTPYLDYPALDIRETKRYLHVYTDKGLSVTWDGDSYLSVSVSKDFKGRMSGLCGNYNGDGRDDLSVSNGPSLHPVAFARQWIVGKKKDCAGTFKSASIPINRCKGWKLFYAHKICSVFRNWQVRKCYSKVNPLVYYQSCILDVCECPSNSRCECGAVKAYTAQCKQRMKKNFRWKSEELCSKFAISARTYFLLKFNN
eukprot:gene17684-19449_t